jgi:hypothetical protein
VHHRQSMGMDLTDAQIEQLSKMGLCKADSFEHSIYQRANSGTATGGGIATIMEGAEEK